MYLNKEEYKKYPFPFGILFEFIITYLVAISVLLVVGNVIIKADYGWDFLNFIPRIGLILILAIVLLGLFTAFNFFDKKIYRGTGLYLFINIVITLTIIAAIVFTFISGKIVKALTFMEVFLLFITCAYLLVWRSIKYKSLYRKCDNCGLVNTLHKTDVQEQKLSTSIDFYVEHGAGMQADVYEKTKRTTTYTCSICDGKNLDVEEYDKRV